jgi:nucleoside-triphosphatase THEP1
MGKVKILTGQVHSGKTTKLMQWAASKKNIDGILQPVIDEKRFIYHIGSRTLKILETAENISENELIIIGKYKFRKSVFDWSQNILVDCLDRNLDWIIIDEIGPLELEGKGLEPVISKIFNQINKLSENLLCVVRDSILEKFVEHYRLESKYDLINQNLF